MGMCIMVILIFKAITPSIFIRLSISVFQDLSILFSDQPHGMWQEMCPKVKKGTFMHFSAFFPMQWSPP